jgi:drug/metabolite transporter (DMT)-like permease
LTIQAAAGSIGYTVLFIQGVTLSNAADAGIVAGTLHAMAALFAAIFLGERPRPRLILAILLATADVMVVASHPMPAAATLHGYTASLRRWLR